jgi:DNA helicase HerA-like ATPase
MVKIITGSKGTGKTKKLIEMINESSKNTNGYVVCIDKGDKLRYDISTSVRLVDVVAYSIYSFESIYGLVAGLVAGNYDIKNIYVDSILKVGGSDYDALKAMFSKIDKLTKDEVEVVFTVSDDESNLPQSMSKYIIGQTK